MNTYYIKKKNKFVRMVGKRVDCSDCAMVKGDQMFLMGDYCKCKKVEKLYLKNHLGEFVEWPIPTGRVCDKYKAESKKLQDGCNDCGYISKEECIKHAFPIRIYYKKKKCINYIINHPNQIYVISCSDYKHGDCSCHVRTNDIKKAYKYMTKCDNGDGMMSGWITPIDTIPIKELK